MRFGTSLNPHNSTNYIGPDETKFSESYGDVLRSLFVVALLYVSLDQCFPKCGKCTTGVTRKDFKGHATENRSLKIVPEFCLLSIEL
jgi:hypothetical protein